MPSSAVPGKWASTSASSPRTRSTSGRATTKTSPSSRARTYSISAPAATAAWEISVHGVVVQTSRLSPGSTGLSGIRRRRHLGDRQAHVDRRVDDVLVALRDLVRGERGAVARAVGDDLVRLVEAPLVPDLAQRPPDRLDVVVGHASRRGRRGRSRSRSARSAGSSPRRSGTPTRGSAALNSAIPYSSISRLRRDPELLLDLELDRQPVAVPARLARDVVAAHRLVARVDVLERAREHVVRARACRSRSAGPRRSSRSARRPRGAGRAGARRRRRSRQRSSTRCSSSGKDCFGSTGRKPLTGGGF